MEYTIKVWRSFSDVIPLANVANAMAWQEATLNGSTDLHKPTFEYSRIKRAKYLFDAAKMEQLIVCDCDGRLLNTQEIIENIGIFPSQDWAYEINHMHVKHEHLIAWSKLSGDIWHIVDSPIKTVNFDLRDEDGNVIKAGYYQGIAAGGMSTEENKPDDTTLATGASAVETSESKSWEIMVIELANKIGLEKWGRGERAITGRNTARAVTAELAKETRYNGNRGPREEGSIRNVLVKMKWKFNPPDGTNGTIGINQN